jgi:hypothetical protein
LTATGVALVALCAAAPALADEPRQVRVLVLYVEAEHPYQISVASNIDEEALKDKDRPPESMRESVLVRRTPSLERSLFTTMQGFDRRSRCPNPWKSIAM